MPVVGLFMPLLSVSFDPAYPASLRSVDETAARLSHQSTSVPCLNGVAVAVAMPPRVTLPIGTGLSLYNRWPCPARPPNDKGLCTANQRVYHSTADRTAFDQ
jgi:hypothetical protein